MAIEKVLTLSTAHIDPDVVVPAYMVDSHQDFSFLTLGALRNSSHEYGWVVYVYPDCPDVPDWFKPIHDRAIEEDCSLILFDQDIEPDENFKTYNW